MKNPRRMNKGYHRYLLDEIFFLVISAVISGCEGWESINEFGIYKLIGYELIFLVIKEFHLMIY